jgi:hypothetical protein
VTQRAAYGPLAERFARALSPSDPAIVFDPSGIAEAVRDCAARRFRNETFYVRAVLQREYAARVDAILPSIVSSFSSTDERRFALEQAFGGTLQVNNQPIGAMTVYSSPALRLMQAAVRLSDGLIVSSAAEQRRVQDILYTDPPTVKKELRDPLVPEPSQARSAGRDAIVVWAPHLSAASAAGFALALGDLRIPIVVISFEVDLERAAQALSRAKVVVDANAFNADTSVALAAWNVPIVADVESGAGELLEGVRGFDRRRAASIFEAVSSALGAAPSIARRRDPPGAQTQVAPLLRDGPRVSIIVPTFDRPAMLRDSLESIARQTYRNVEAIVVVDGGPRLDALAADYPSVRFLYMLENDAVASCNAAFSQAGGDYVTFLNDDDLFFPHHVAALVTALERSGAAVANGDVLTAFLRGSDESWLLYGLESNMSRAVEASSLLVSNQIGMTSCMFRRAAIADGLPFDAIVPLTRDYALWMRLATEYDFVHVESITSCYTIRNQGARQQSIERSNLSLESYRVLYQRYPVENRPLLRQRREQILQSMSQGAMGLQSEPPAGEIRPVPWPLWDTYVS